MGSDSDGPRGLWASCMFSRVTDASSGAVSGPWAIHSHREHPSQGPTSDTASVEWDSPPGHGRRQDHGQLQYLALCLTISRKYL